MIVSNNILNASGSIKNPSQLSKENAAGASINIRIPYDTDDHGKDYFEMGTGQNGKTLAIAEEANRLKGK